MIYNLQNDFDVKRSDTRYEHLKKKGSVIELTERTKRTLNQNSYLHLCLNLFALEYGEKMEWVKLNFFKKLVNPDLFVKKKTDKILGETEEIRSSKELTVEEMITALDRFKIWSTEVAGIFIPDAFSEEDRVYIEQQIERNKNFL